MIMNLITKLGLQLFADAGTLVNATGNYVNASTGTVTAFDATHNSHLGSPIIRSSMKPAARAGIL